MEQHALPATPVPDAEADPKTWREFLLSGVISQLQDIHDRTKPDWDQEESQVGRTPSRYWAAWHEASGLSIAITTLRHNLRTLEENLLLEREISHLTPPTEEELACARHRETCTMCLRHWRDLGWDSQQKRATEQSRAILVDGLHRILDAIRIDKERVTDGKPAWLTIDKLEHEIRRVKDAGHKAWQQRKPRATPRTQQTAKNQQHRPHAPTPAPEQSGLFDPGPFRSTR